MRGVTRRGRRDPSRPLIGALLAVVAATSACSGPELPTPTPAPTPTPTTLFHLSGRVLDDAGAPVPGAIVAVEYSSAGGASAPPSICPSSGQFCWFSVRSDPRGEYAVEFTPRPWPGRGLGYVYSFSDRHEMDVQWVPGPSPAVLDMNLRLTRPIPAGESTVISVAPTSSLCTDKEDLFVLDHRCEIVVIEAGPGTLVVEARATSGTVVPSMFWYTTGNYAGFITRPAPGTVSIPVRGGSYRVMVALPEGTATQQFRVTTSLR